MAETIGVGFLIFVPIDGAWKIYVVREKRGKPEYKKKSGMLSFPLETFEVRDICPKNTLIRLLNEETDIPAEKVKDVEFSFEKFWPIPGRGDVTILYGFGKFSGDPNQEFKPKDNDVEFAGWFTFEELLSCFTRVEVAPLLAHFVANFSEKLKEQK